MKKCQAAVLQRKLFGTEELWLGGTIVCQAAEQRVSGFSSFVEQRSCHFFWVKGMLRVWIALVNVSSWSSLRVFSSYLTGGRACWCSPCLSDSWGGRAFTDVSLVGFDP